MNLLIIGNGLDLDLGLPTKYADFLDFTKAFTFLMRSYISKIDEFDICNHTIVDCRYAIPKSVIMDNSYNESHKNSCDILSKFDKIFSNEFINKICKDFFYCVHNNCWIEYFNNRYKKNLIAGENWIDLEGEIQNVIIAFEKKKFFKITNLEGYRKSVPDSVFAINMLKNLLISNDVQPIVAEIFIEDYKNLKKSLLKDFEKFIMALGIYLDFFVCQLTPNFKDASKQLQKLMTKEDDNSIDCVLSFNYINNFKKNNLSIKNVCFIHGAVNYFQDLEERLTKNLTDDDKEFLKIENFITRNKMIIGFDDLQEDEENFKLEFIDYRKYFQRIYKGTDSSYADWLKKYQDELKYDFYSQTTTRQNKNYDFDKYLKERLKNSSTSGLPNKVFIYGHSLDATDNEILKDILLREHDDTKVTIFYHDPEARKRIITNLIKILGKPTLIEKTKGRKPLISFVKQTY